MACRFAFFLAQDTFDHTGTLLKSLLYMVMYYSFAQPRAVIWQMYLCTVAIVYACTGTAYLMSQVLTHLLPSEQCDQFICHRNKSACPCQCQTFARCTLSCWC